MLAEHDPLRGSGRELDGSGVVEVIALSSESEGAMTVAPSAEAIAGCGLRDDRYERGAGTFSNPEGRGYDLILVEAEALEDLTAKGVELEPAEARRNLVVRGIALDDLIAADHRRVRGTRTCRCSSARLSLRLSCQYRLGSSLR